MGGATGGIAKGSTGVINGAWCRGVVSDINYTCAQPAVMR